MQNLPGLEQDLLSIGKASKILGVSIDTIRRWEKDGKIRLVRTPGGTRLVPIEEIKRIKNKELSFKHKQLTSTPPPPPASFTPALSPAPSLIPEADKTKPKEQDKLHQKILHHIKYTRPSWYIRYHKIRFAEAVHYTLLAVYLVLVGSFLLYSFVIKPGLDKTRDDLSKQLARVGEVLPATSPPSVLSFQGRLTDENDVPVSTATNIVFKIFNVETGGSPLWTSKTWTVTPDQNGIFSVCLGNQTTTDDCLINGVADTAFPSDLFTDNAALYLQVEVETEVLSPRQRIASVAYARNSDAVDGFHASQSPGANQVVVLNSSGDLIFGGAATIGTGGSGALTLDSGSGSLVLGAGTNTLVNTDASTALLLDPTGNLQFQSSSNFIDASGNLTIGGDFTLSESTPSINFSDTTSGEDDWLVIADGDNLNIRNTGGTGGDLVFQNSTPSAIATLYDTGQLELVQNGFTTTGINQAILIDSTITKDNNNEIFIGYDYIPTIDINISPVNNSFGDPAIFSRPIILVDSNIGTIQGENVSFAGQQTYRVTGANIGSQTFSGTQSSFRGFIITENAGSGSTNLTISDYRVFHASHGNFCGGFGTSPCIGTGTTVTNLAGFYMSNVGNSGTLTNQYGLYIESLTSATNDYGARIDAADTQTLWLSGNADNTTSSAGIAFGASRDTNLYRSAANELRTDDTFSAAGFKGGGLVDCDASGRKLIWDSTTSNFSCGYDRATVAIRKPSDETVTNSATAQDDDHFTFAVGTNETWIVEYWIQYTAPTANDILFQVDGPNGSACVIGIIDYDEGPGGIHNTACNTDMVLSTDSATDETAIVFGTVTTNSTSGNIILQWAQGTAGAGTSTIVRAGSHMKAYRVDGADLAEIYYSKSGAILPGTLVSIDPSIEAGVKKTASAYDRNLLGVVTTKPGQVLADSNGGVGVPVGVALTGRVPVRVNGENGPIEPGDPLTSSSTPGVAMKATRAGYIIGRALTNFSGKEEGTILAFVNTHYSNPIILEPSGELLQSENQTTPTDSANEVYLSLDPKNNLVATISNNAKFVWKNNVGETLAWVLDTGEAFFQKVNALVGDFQKLVFGELYVKKEAKTAGEASLNTGEAEIFIESDKATESSLIHLTAKTKTGGFSLYLKEIIPGKGFTVALERSRGDLPNEATATATQTIKFNWFIINQE